MHGTVGSCVEGGGAGSGGAAVVSRERSWPLCCFNTMHLLELVTSRCTCREPQTSLAAEGLSEVGTLPLTVASALMIEDHHYWLLSVQCSCDNVTAIDGSLKGVRCRFNRQRWGRQDTVDNEDGLLLMMMVVVVVMAMMVKMIHDHNNDHE